MGTIYRIYNTITCKNYIGVTKQDVQERWAQHRRQLQHNEHVNVKLQSSWNKHGEQNFFFEVLETDVPLTDLYHKEINYIAQFDSYNNGYNLTRGGDKGCSEWWEKKVYVYDLKGCYIKSFCSRAEAQRQLDCHSIKECCLQQCKRGFSKVDQKWYMFSYEYYESIPPYTSNNVNSKEFYKLDERGQILDTYPSMHMAASEHGITSLSHLREAAQNHTLFHCYYWSYADQYQLDWKPCDKNKIIALQDNEEIGRYPSAMAASRALGISNSGISKALKSGRPICGYTFQFIEKGK